MPKDIVQEYVDEQYKKFKDNLELAKKSKDKESIHQYRIAIKRIKAIHYFINGDKSKIKKLKKIFKKGGPIRDLQIELKIINNIEKDYIKSFPLLKKYLKKKIKKKKIIVDIDYEKEYENLISQFNIEISNYLIYSILDEIRDEINKIEYPHQLHKLRMKIKKLFYFLEMINKSVNKDIENELKKLGQEIGDWHDHFQLLLTINSIENSSLEKEIENLRKIIYDIHISEFERLKDRLKNDEILQKRLQLV